MRPTPVSSLPARARYTCPGHVGFVPSFPRRDPRLPRPVGIVPSLSFSPPVPVCVAAGFSPASFFPLSTANFRPLYPLSPLECADPQIAPITPLDCAVPKTKDLKSFGMRSSEKSRGWGQIVNQESYLDYCPEEHRGEAFLLCCADHCSLTTAHFLLNGHATCPTCRAMVSSSAAGPPSSYHRRRQNNRRRFPSLRRAAVSRWNCRMLRKLSGRRLSQICNRPPAQTTSPARIPDVLQRPPSHRVSPRSPCATHPPEQSVFRSHASVRPHRAARRRTSPSPFRSSRFCQPAGHNRNYRTTPHPSTQDKHFSAAWRRSRLPQLPGRESRLRDKPFHTAWASGYTSSSQSGSSRSFSRDSHSPALRPSPSSRCLRRKYAPLCWDTENPRDSRSRTPRDAGPFPARRCRWHPRASDDTQAASPPSALPKPDPAAAAFSCARCAPANSSGPRGA